MKRAGAEEKLPEVMVAGDSDCSRQKQRAQQQRNLEEKARMDRQERRNVQEMYEVQCFRAQQVQDAPQDEDRRIFNEWMLESIRQGSLSTDFDDVVVPCTGGPIAPHAPLVAPQAGPAPATPGPRPKWRKGSLWRTST